MNKAEQILESIEKLSKSSINEKYALYMKGGSIAHNKGPLDHPVHGKHIQTYDHEEEAKAVAKRRNAQLSPGEKTHYRIKYHVKPIKV